MCGWKLCALCTCGTCSGLAGAGAGKLLSPYLVSPGPTPRAGHMEPHVPELLLLSQDIALPRLGSCWCSQTVRGRSSAAAVPQNRGSSGFRAGRSREAPKGPACASAVLARAWQGKWGSRNLVGKGLMGEWVLRPIPDCLMNRWQLSPSPSQNTS